MDSQYVSFMTNPFVRKLEGLVNLDQSARNDVIAATDRPRRYAARRDLIREGDETGPVFVVLDGWVARYKILPNGNRQIMAFLIPGDACDLHIDLVKQMDHGLQAVTEAQVATIQRGHMERMMVDHPSFARAMYTAQLIDEGTLRAWIVSMGRRSSIERVAHLMCELYLRLNAIGLAAPGEPVILPLSQLILADALGMTPVHINRVLKELRLASAMEIKRGKLVIIDPAMLVQIAGFDENYLHRRATAVTTLLLPALS